MRNVLIFLVFALTIGSCQNNTPKIDSDINAADYGLVEGKDGTQAIINALEDAKLKSARRLIIPKGKYFFSNEKALEKYIAISNNDNGMKRMVFVLIGFNDFEIDAQGSEFVFHGSMIPFVIENSKNIALKGFSVNWDTRWFGQAEVVSVNRAANSFNVKIENEFPYEIHKGSLYFKTADGFHDSGKNLFFYPDKGGTVHNVDNYKLAPWDPWHIDSYQAVELEKGTVRIQPHLKKMLPQPGWIWVTKGSQKNDRLNPAIRIYESFDIDLINVGIYQAGGMGVIGEKSGNITIDSMTVVADPKSGNAVSTSADATHFVNCKGMITVSNSYFAHMLDDAINVHGIYVQIAEKIDDFTMGIRQMHEEQWGFDFAGPGDTIIVTNNQTLMPVDTFVVKAYRWFNEQYQELTVNKPIGENVELKFGLENLSWNAGLTFANNTVEKNRARGILFSTRGPVVVEGNTFSNMMAGISISGDNNFWFESGPCDSVVIRNNRFINCTSGGKGNTVILIEPMILKPDLSEGYYNRHISISGNSFEAFDKGILNTISVQHLEFIGNTINHQPDLTPIFPGKPTFEIRNCESVIISDNRFNDFQDGSILIDSRSGKGLKVENNVNRSGGTNISD